ncbi:FAD-dependent oxidoreductase [Parapusillimonas granuli]|uniref:FAD-dependent oxidoreductase n=1 Tax=Parapusillimonas granuli TaxID=380911 RepID=A0A853G5F0_9BURK|nr:FAD-dependent oxidoreductase [Parapusillimonas granuli]MBB5215517.1 3-phenylpropionate/trans-cinnamate dioxygenase ferredoxin reductase subunit [Parapusillimonas granuli]MEB2400360.1 FAD-dependent oxidoreductase [Alcaligenaceae bacterium]NYT49816.1 FAD-dependent oxidoreductase [Parapusillimonas granuli]
MSTTPETLAAQQSAPGTVIIGAGHAGVECAFALRTAGYTLPITLLGAEACEPYQRPPLSKGFLSGAMAAERLALRSPQVYEKHGIQVHAGDPAAQLDCASSVVTTASGRRIGFQHCVIATGAHARTLPVLHGPDVYVLRNLADARALQARLADACRLLVVGGGYLGLEAAATAAKLGAQVVVLESSPALMSGKVSAHASTEFDAMHGQAGICLRRNATRVDWAARPGGGWTALLPDGTSYDADAVLVSIGAEPDTGLAESAGIACDGGILVDAQFRSSAPAVFAIGDCARAYRHELGARARVESVQNALDSARAAAAAIAMQAPPAGRPPTFWSEQHGRRLQIAGIVNPAIAVQDVVTRSANGWLVERYQQGLLAAVEALDSPVEFIKSMKRIGSPPQP